MGRTFTSNIVKQMEDGKFFIYETPIGAINGINSSFTLTYAPKPVNSLIVFLNGQKMTVTEDYSISSDTLALNTVPPSGSILNVEYHVTP